jgi:undecaprenyl-diphosphatase
LEWFQAVVLGILQGLTEFLPISSSAHLRIYPELFGWEDPGAAFTAVIQIGTEAAIITYLARDIGRIIEAWARSLTNRDALRSHELVRIGGTHRVEKTWDPQDARLGWYVIAGSVPIVVLGITLKDVIETDFRSLWIVGTTLVVLGCHDQHGVVPRIRPGRRRAVRLLAGHPGSPRGRDLRVAIRDR